MAFLTKPARLLLTYLVLLLPAFTALAQDAEFPVPDSIRPAIGFWIKVYTEADTESGFLHDAETLSIIYQKLPRDRVLIESRRKEIIADLKVLASGKRTGLSSAQQEILSLWGGNTSNARFGVAAQNIRWQLGQSDRYREGLVRSGAYRQHIRNVVREMGLPEELAALPHVESSFHPGAFSSVAASGMWQFMRETATRFMRVDLIVDERLDPYTATNAAMELLKNNHRALGNWPLALTAYNHGTNGMARAVRDTGTRDIGRIITEYKGPRFGFASRNFYPQFLAALEVERNAEKYYGKVNMDPAPDFATYEMTSYVDAAVMAQSLGISLDTLKKYNPALLSVVWSGNKRIPKGYTLKIDKSAFQGNLREQINQIAASNFHNAQIPDVSYVVRSGDSMSSIANRFDTSVSELVAINQLRDRNRIRVGQTLVLPQKNGAVPTLVVNNDPPQALPDTGRYEVRRGDTISAIARRFKLSPTTLLALNGLGDDGVIQPGQELRLKPEGSSPALVRAASENTLNSQLTNALDQTQQQFAAAKTQPEPAQQATDPGEFAVSADGSIEILADETLGHYADWLKVSVADLRKVNKFGNNANVKVGDRLKLDLSKVDKGSFATKRTQHHNELQARYFAAWRIRDTVNYSIKRSDLLMSLVQKRSIPMWLFRQYNPNVDASLVRVGQVVVFPVVEKITN